MGAAASLNREAKPLLERALSTCALTDVPDSLEECQAELRTTRQLVGQLVALVQQAQAQASPEAAAAPSAAVPPPLPAADAALPGQPLAQVQADTSKTCVARIQSALSVVAARNGEVNACVEVLNKAALAAAEAADARLAKGEARRPLEGVPVLIKANIDVAGSLSTAGTPALADHRPETTAPIVTRLTEAGAIVVAKTNMPEMAFGVWGWCAPHGLTRNPLNPAVTTGGSSAGTAAGIAAGIARCGLGTDTGGSCRVPAACCGIAGLRPSRGRYPDEGIVPCSPKCETPGPIATTVHDLAVLDAVLAGEPPAEVRAATAEELKALVVTVEKDVYAEANPAQKRALDAAFAAFEAAGATCKREGVELNKAATFAFTKLLSYRQEGLEAYLASHEKCAVTAEDLLAKATYPFLKLVFAASGPGAGSITGSTLTNVKAIPEGEREAAEATHQAELQEYEAQYTGVFESSGAEIILSLPINGNPSPVLTEAEYGDFSKAGPGFKLIRNRTGKFMELPVPSLSMPVPGVVLDLADIGGNEVADTETGTAAQPIPASIMLWAKPRADKTLLQVAMALEQAFGSASAEEADAPPAAAAVETETAETETAETKTSHFIIFNNGSGGDGDVTFSFGGSHNDDFSEVKHNNAEQHVLAKFEFKLVVDVPIGAMFIATIPDGPPVLVACPAEAGHNNPWLRAAGVHFEGSEQEELAKAMEAPKKVQDDMRSLVGNAENEV